MEKPMEDWEVELRRKVFLGELLTNCDAIRLLMEIDRLKALAERQRELRLAMLR